MSKVCLNMIVKNESRIITRLLESVSGIIDTYCICDTGSTDNTVEIIETFFREKNIPGKVVQEPFRDFGYNRTYALKQCAGMENADYILLLDADMIFKVHPSYSIEQMKSEITKYDVMHIYQGTDTFYYKNVRVVKNNRNIEYWGVTHEYVKTFDGAVFGTFDRNQVFINDIGDGGCKSDKFVRDVALLSRALEENPNNDRYTFYLANSYRDSGQAEKAIETYKKRISLGGWFEEVWFSNYNIARCYQSLGNMPSAIHYWMEAYNLFPQRLENLFEIIHYYRNIGKNNVAYAYYCMAEEQMKHNENPDYLFLHKDVYDYKIDYELTIIGYYCNHRNYDIQKACMKVLAANSVPGNIIKNVLSNYKFYAAKLKDLSVEMSQLQVLKNFMLCYEGFESSTPSLAIHDGQLAVLVRYVNYRIDENGGYINQQNIITKNVLSTYNINGNVWFQTSQEELDYEKRLDNLYIGLEDMRIISNGKELVYNANRGLGPHMIAVEHGKINDNLDGCVNSFILSKNGQVQIEKNWVLIPPSNEKENLKCIYGWAPLTIGEINKEKTPNFEVLSETPTPNFFKHLRGSTNGVVVKNEIWFICHIVSYEERRYYYHIVVALDKETLNLKRYSKMFTFEGNKVEYTLGFVFHEPTDHLWIGYSIMDKSTEFISVPRKNIESLF